jgi:hypothetical protein
VSVNIDGTRAEEAPVFFTTYIRAEPAPGERKVKGAGPGLSVQSHDHEDARREFARMCREHEWRLVLWDVEQGFRVAGQEGETADQGGDPLAAIRSVKTSPLILSFGSVQARSVSMKLDSRPVTPKCGPWFSKGIAANRAARYRSWLKLSRSRGGTSFGSAARLRGRL